MLLNTGSLINHFRHSVWSIVALVCIPGILSSCSSRISEAELHFNPRLSAAMEQAGVLRERGYFTQAEGLLADSVARIGQLSLLDRLELYNFHYSTYICGPLEDYSRALAYTDSMQGLLEGYEQDAGIQSLYARTLHLKGDVFFLQKKYNQAYEYFFRAGRLGALQSDSCINSDYTYRLGMVLYQQDRYLDAARHFVRSFQLNAPCKNDFGRTYRTQELLNNAGLSYSRCGHLDSARGLLNQALAYIEAHRAHFGYKAYSFEMAQGVIYGNLARVEELQGNAGLAAAYYKNSIRINNRPGYDVADAQLSGLGLAGLYISQGRLQDATALLSSIRGALDTLNLLEGEARWQQQMGRLEQARHNWQSALNHLTAYTAHTDSIRAGKRQLRETELMEQLRNLEDAQRIDELMHKNERKHWSLIGGLVVLLALLLIIFLIWQNWRRSKSHVRKLIALNHEVRERKNRLNEAHKKLSESSLEKDRILRVVAHDLRNPVAGISSLVSLLQEDERLPASEQLAYFGLMRQACDQALDLIGHILEASGAQQAQTYKFSQQDLNQILTDSVALLRGKAAEKSQQIRLQLPAEPCMAEVDGKRIWRVVTNLLSNAVKFSPAGRDIAVSLSRQGAAACIAVRDQGIGIAPEAQGRVFDMFTEVRRPGTNQEQTFGLGLSICRQIVDTHGGHIWLESMPGAGTTFFVTLPLQRKAAGLLPQPAGAAMPC